MRKEMSKKEGESDLNGAKGEWQKRREERKNVNPATQLSRC